VSCLVKCLTLYAAEVLVMIGGQIAWQNNELSKNLGKTKMGEILRAVNSKTYLAQQAASAYKEHASQDKEAAMSA
jgi:hypothetical protein